MRSPRQSRGRSRRAAAPPSHVLGPTSFRNAVVCLHAIGGSTNAVIHLLAIARRAGVDLTLADIDQIGRDVPVLLDLKPSGTGYMEDFHRAGGVPALLAALEPRLDLRARMVTGESLEDRLARVGPPGDYQRVIGSLAKPLKGPSGLRVPRQPRPGRRGAEGCRRQAPTFSVTRARRWCRRRRCHPPPRRPGTRRSPRTACSSCGTQAQSARDAGGGIPADPAQARRPGVRDMVRVSDARMSGTRSGPSCCTAHRRRRRGTARSRPRRRTSSDSMSTEGGSTCSSTRTNSTPVAAPFLADAPTRGGCGCTARPSPRPTSARPTWTSWSALRGGRGSFMSVPAEAAEAGTSQARARRPAVREVESLISCGSAGSPTSPVDRSTYRWSWPRSCPSRSQCSRVTPSRWPWAAAASPESPRSCRRSSRRFVRPAPSRTSYRRWVRTVVRHRPANRGAG